MTQFHIKYQWFIAITFLLMLLSFQLHATCYRCNKNERERAREQAKNPQPWRYYDENIQNGQQDQAEVGSRGPKRGYHRSKLNRTEQNQNHNLSSIFLHAKSDENYLAQAEENQNGTRLNQSEEFRADEVITITSGNRFESESQLRNPREAYSALLTIFKTRSFLETLDGSFTLFLPTNEAFSKIEPKIWQDLLKPENRDKLASIVSNHVVGKKFLLRDLEASDTIKAISGRNLTINSKNGEIMVNGARILRIEPGGYDGVIYVIEDVLFP